MCHQKDSSTRRSRWRGATGTVSRVSQRGEHHDFKDNGGRGAGGGGTATSPVSYTAIEYLPH